MDCSINLLLSVTDNKYKSFDTNLISFDIDQILSNTTAL